MKNSFPLFDSEVGLVEMWTAVIDRLAAWGMDAAVRPRLLKDRYPGLLRGRVTRPSKRFQILRGNDSPCADWLERMIVGFDLDRRSATILFDVHERTMGDDRSGMLKRGQEPLSRIGS